MKDWAVVMAKVALGLALYVTLGELTANRVDRWSREQCEAAPRMDRSTRTICLVGWPVLATLFVLDGKAPFAGNM